MAEPASRSELTALWRKHRVENKSTGKAVKLGIAGSFTVDPLIPYLGGYLLGEQYNPQFLLAPYNQVFQVCFDYQAYFQETRPEVILLLWRLEDLLPEKLQIAKLTDAGQFQAFYDELDALLNAVKNLAESFNGSIIISTPPYPTLASFNTLELNQSRSGALLYRRLLQRWLMGLDKINKVKTLDLDRLLSRIGYQQGQDTRKWYLYKQPYSESLWQLVGEQVSRLIVARSKSPKKCIVLDGDNTLWGGIVGEDGLEGIQLGPDFPGSAFVDFQKVLLSLAQSGIFLAVASKNNAADVFEVFDKHDSMVLTRQHIAHFEVHWDSKVLSIQNIAKRLNITTDAMVFIDDNPVEIAEVRHSLPEVTCIQVREEEADLPGLLLSSNLFDFDKLTDDDVHRVQRQQDEKKRHQQVRELTQEKFLHSLELKIRVFQAQANDQARITQLINKSNQFNLTTIRRTEEEVQVLINSPEYQVLAMKVHDKYGDYGLVGVAILSKYDMHTWFVDTLLMSCRVLGRGVESAFLAYISELAMLSGAKQIYGVYKKTEKNDLVKNLYQEHGFEERHDGWYLVLNKPLPAPAHIEQLKC